MSKQNLKADVAAVEVLGQEKINELAALLGLKTPAARQFLILSLANARLFDRKQQDYGPGNIAKFGTFGTIVRMTDKFERLRTVFGKPRRSLAVQESISDTLRDIHNYANIALLLEEGKWEL